MNIEIKIMTIKATLVFSDFNITVRKSAGSQNVRSVRFQAFCGCHLFFNCSVILSSGPQSVNTTFGLALSLVYFFYERSFFFFFFF